MASSSQSPPRGDNLFVPTIPIPTKFAGAVDRDSWGNLPFFNPDERDETKLSTRMLYLLGCYEADDLTGRDLFNEYQSDFGQWPEAAFEAVAKEVRTYVRDKIIRRGVKISCDGGSVARHIRLCEDVAFRKSIKYDMTRLGEEDERHPPPTLPERQNNSWNTSPEETETPLEDNTVPPAPLSEGTDLPKNDKTQGRFHQVPGVAWPNYQLPPGYMVLPSGRLWPGSQPVPGTDVPPKTPTRWPDISNSVPDHVPTPPMLTDLSKLYTDEMKYGGGPSYIFETKVMIFRDNCYKAGIPQTKWGGAFSVMLKGRALAYYYHHMCDPDNPLSFHDAGIVMKSHFESDESRQAHLNSWRKTTFVSIIRDNPGKTKTEALEILFDKLSVLQQAFPNAHQTDQGLRDQVLSACRGVKECDMALFNPGPTFESVCNQLRSADTSPSSYNHYLAWHEGVEGVEPDEEDEIMAQYVQALDDDNSNTDEDDKDDTEEPFSTSFSTTALEPVDGTV
ncbi:glycosyl transferase [Colletotrichum plurivorum]|uniref:Glycosyl transferase n=1 Tax=Colletotrichum plurivorum TaxID=2175906 RepID=A0A8H6MS67_9PEZI|nr:glycosyl transferase [Colletotrichum plurivorum]